MRQRRAINNLLKTTSVLALLTAGADAFAGSGGGAEMQPPSQPSNSNYVVNDSASLLAPNDKIYSGGSQVSDSIRSTNSTLNTFFFTHPSQTLTLDSTLDSNGSVTFDSYGNNAEIINVSSQFAPPITFANTKDQNNDVYTTNNSVPITPGTSTAPNFIVKFNSSSITSSLGGSNTTNEGPSATIVGGVENIHQIDFNAQSNSGLTIGDSTNSSAPLAALTLPGGITSTGDTGANGSLVFAQSATLDGVTTAAAGTTNNFNNITVNTGATLTIQATNTNSSITPSSGIILDNNAKLNIIGASDQNNGYQLNIGAVYPYNDANGDITSSGNVSIGQLGATASSTKPGAYLNSLTFQDSPGAVVDINGDINANTISFGAGTYNFNNPTTNVSDDGNQGGEPVTIHGGAILNIGTNNVTFTSAHFKDGIVTIKADVDLSQKLIPSKLEVTNRVHPENATIIVDLAGGTLPAGYIAKDFFTSVHTPIGESASGLLITHYDTLLQWRAVAVDGEDNSIGLESYYDPEGYTNILESKGANPNASQLITPLTTATSGTASKLLNLICEVDPDTSTDALNRMTAAPTSHQMTMASIDAVNGITYGRMSEISGGDQSISTSGGVSSGDLSSEDESLDIGVWAQGFMGSAAQGKYKTNPGFKSNISGGIIGVDSYITESLLVGLGLSYSESTVKFKDAKAGDKTKASNILMSLYGSLDLPYNTFVKAIASFGSSQVDSKSKRVIAQGAYDTAKSSHTDMMYSIGADLGYKYRLMQNTSIIPTIGLKYSSFLGSGYTETGSQYNLKVDQKLYNKLTGSAGIRVENKTNFAGKLLTTHAHVIESYDFNSKGPKVSGTMDGLADAFDMSPSKSSNFSTMFGVGASVTSGNIEYGIGYDGKASAKYLSNQGNLKLKVNL